MTQRTSCLRGREYPDNLDSVVERGWASFSFVTFSLSPKSTRSFPLLCSLSHYSFRHLTTVFAYIQDVISLLYIFEKRTAHVVLKMSTYFMNTNILLPVIYSGSEIHINMILDHDQQDQRCLSRPEINKQILGLFEQISSLCVYHPFLAGVRLNACRRYSDFPDFPAFSHIFSLLTTEYNGTTIMVQK